MNAAVSNHARRPDSFFFARERRNSIQFGDIGPDEITKVIGQDSINVSSL